MRKWTAVKDKIHRRLDAEDRYKKRTGKAYPRIMDCPREMTPEEKAVLAFLKEW